MSPEFRENVMLLLISAVLTGIVIPIVLKIRDDRKFREQKIFEAELARQGKVIDAQAAFLETFSGLLCEYQFLALSVAYYFLENNRERYVAASVEYDAKSWDFLAKLRAEITKAKRLVPQALYDDLVTFFEDILIVYDAKISGSTAATPDAAGWDAFREQQGKGFGILYDLFYTKFPAEIDTITTKLASELQLLPSQTVNKKELGNR